MFNLLKLCYLYDNNNKNKYNNIKKNYFYIYIYCYILLYASHIKIIVFTII